MVTAALLCARLAPWLMVRPHFRLPLLFFAFLWANARICPRAKSENRRALAVILVSLLCTVGTSVPVAMLSFEHVEKELWKTMMAERDRLFPYTVTNTDGSVSRVSSPDGPNTASHGAALSHRP